MKRLRRDIPEARVTEIRGGKGGAERLDYLSPGDMAGADFVSVLTLDPGATVGEHLHPAEEELYLVLQGEGSGLLDGETFPVGPGDAFLCKAGHTHGLVNPGPKPLTFLAVLAKATGKT
ncbi:MAG: cupin domain-containing protein [Acidobacteriota bacterium]